MTIPMGQNTNINKLGPQQQTGEPTRKSAAGILEIIISVVLVPPEFVRELFR